MNTAIPIPAADSSHARNCRFCGSNLETTFVDLGMSPLCQTHIETGQLNHMEPFYPLHAWVCGKCFLVQLEEYVTPDNIFSEYAYFSSYADSWVEHARKYTELMRSRFGIGAQSLVMGNREQRRLPPATLRRSQRARARYRAGRQRRESGEGSWHPHRGVLPRAPERAHARLEIWPGRSCAWQ